MSDPDVLPPEMWRTVRFPRIDPLGLDEQTSDRLLAGTMLPDDAPPSYRGVARVIEALTRTGPELPDRGDMVVDLAAVCASPSRPTSWRSSMPRKLLSSTSLSVAALAGGLTLFSGLAAAGVLPGAAQGVASDMLAKVGLSVPGPDDHAGDHPDTRGDSADDDSSEASQPDDTKGALISETARTTDATGVDKGAEISGLASDGKSKAGEDHGADTPSQADQGLSHRP